jgi:hypothetical protein
VFLPYLSWDIQEAVITRRTPTDEKVLFRIASIPDCERSRMKPCTITLIQFAALGGTVSRHSAFRLGSALGLSLLLALVSLPGIGRADDDDDKKKKNNNESQQTTSKNKKNSSGRSNDPDLEVTGLTLLTNALGQVSDREIQFRVVNIGDEDAPATTARVEITGPVVNVSGSDPTVVRTVAVPALRAGGNPFYGTAELPGVCDGHIVEVEVQLKDDGSSGNNSVGPTKVCPEKPPVSAGGPAGTLDQARRQGTGLSLPNPEAANTVDYGDATIIPENQRPGTHTVMLYTSQARYGVVNHNVPVVSTTDLDTGAMAVGWGQRESAFGSSTVAQAAVNFDLTDLDEIPRKFVSKAVLTFGERALKWTDSEGAPRTVAGCVAVLGLATESISDHSAGLFSNEYYTDVIPSASREWDVTGQVRRQLQFPEDPTLRFGYVLRGALEQLDIDDDTSCISAIYDVRLHITYVVPAN